MSVRKANISAEWVTVPGAAAILGRGPRVVHRLIARGELTAQRLPFSRPLVRRADVVALAEKSFAPRRPAGPADSTQPATKERPDLNPARDSPAAGPGDA
jgi:hypothetical protein